MHNTFKALIEKYDTIVIARHEHPDGDALGSQFGLKQWILENYPNKHVYAIGKEKARNYNFPDMDIIEDEIFKDALSICLDCSGVKRLDDKRAAECKEILKIDHHPNDEPYGTVNIVDADAASCTQVLAKLMKALEDKVVSCKCADYLYRGMLTDSMCFKISDTTAETLEMAAFLASKGIDIPQINREMFDMSYEVFKLTTALRSKVQIRNEHFAYIYLTLQDLESLGISGNRSREFVSEIGSVDEFWIWAIFNQRFEDGQMYIDASLRSKTIPINGIAGKYGGGGHNCASGVKGIPFEKFDDILNDLTNALNN